MATSREALNISTHIFIGLVVFYQVKANREINILAANNC